MSTIGVRGKACGFKTHFLGAMVWQPAARQTDVIGGTLLDHPYTQQQTKMRKERFPIYFPDPSVHEQ